MSLARDHAAELVALHAQHEREAFRLAAAARRMTDPLHRDQLNDDAGQHRASAEALAAAIGALGLDVVPPPADPRQLQMLALGDAR